MVTGVIYAKRTLRKFWCTARAFDLGTTPRRELHPKKIQLMWTENFIVARVH